jgi:protein-disulfide isomerase
MKNILIVSAIVVAIIAGAMALDSKKDRKTNSANSRSESTAIAEAQIYGSKDSKVKLVEYGDFQCPACGAYFPLVKEIKEKYKDQISFEFKNFPLTQKHLNAQAAHRAAHAAGLQGKFWEMHDKLYESQASWSQSNGAIKLFEEYANSLGLNMDQYKADVASGKTNDYINQDIEDGQELGVNSTPTFFLNGKELTEASAFDTIDEFSKLIDDAIAEANTTPE